MTSRALADVSITARPSLRERTKRIGKQILEVQNSVATLRATTSHDLATTAVSLIEDLRSPTFWGLGSNRLGQKDVGVVVALV